MVKSRKIIKPMKKQSLILIVFIFSCLTLDAGDYYIKNRWTVKASTASYPGLLVTNHGQKLSYGNYRVEANYGLLNFLEIGGYLGYSRLTSYLPVTGPFISENQNTPFFGVNLNLQLLSFIVKRPDFRFDLYLLGRYGGVYYSSPENYYPYKGFLFQYHHGVGLAFYVRKHIGIFGEYSVGILAKSSGNLRYGLCVKF
jgi:hypothetical protein